MKKKKRAATFRTTRKLRNVSRSRRNMTVEINQKRPESLKRPGEKISRINVTSKFTSKKGKYSK